MKYDKVHQIYNKFIENPDIDPTLVSIFKILKQLLHILT